MEFNFNTKSEILNFNFMHDTQKKMPFQTNGFWITI